MAVGMSVQILQTKWIDYIWIRRPTVMTLLRKNVHLREKESSAETLLSGLPMGGPGLPLYPVRLFDLNRSRSDLEDEDDARRCRCIWAGSMSGIFARRANKESTTSV